jgi:DNA primase large subunit
MATKTKDESETEVLLKALEELRARVATLEAKQAEAEKVISPETVSILAAAATAFMGKKVRIRAAREIHSTETAWERQGRATLMASHNLSR